MPPSSRDLEFVAPHLGKVGALDADQSGFGLAPRRMQIALVVEMSRARHQAVGANLLDFAGLAVRRLLDQPPVGHLGYAGDLAVDRPARAVIVRRAALR